MEATNIIIAGNVMCRCRNFMSMPYMALGLSRYADMCRLRI